MEDSQQWGRAEWGKLGTAASPLSAHPGKAVEGEESHPLQLDTVGILHLHPVGGSLPEGDSQLEVGSQPEGRGQEQPEVGLDKQYRDKEEEHCQGR